MAYASTFSALSMYASPQEVCNLDEVLVWAKDNLSKDESLLLDSKLEMLLSRKDKSKEMIERVKGKSDYCESFTYFPHVHRGFYYMAPKGKESLIKEYGDSYLQLPYEQKTENYKDEDFEVKIGDLEIKVEIDLSSEKGFKLIIGNKYGKEKEIFFLNRGTFYSRNMAKAVIFGCSSGWIFVDHPEKKGKRLFHAIDWVKCIQQVLDGCPVGYTYHKCLVAGCISLYQQIMYCLDKSYNFTKKLEAICEKYEVNVVEAKRCIIEKVKYPFRFEFKLNNWQRKRLCSDLSFLLVIYGLKPLGAQSKNVRPSKFVKELMRDVRVHEDELLSSNANGEIDIGKLNEEEEPNSIGVSGKEVAEVIGILDKGIEVFNERASKEKKKTFKRIEHHKSMRLECMKANVKNILKPDYLSCKKEIDRNPLFRKAAIMNGNIVKEKEQSNINTNKLSYKDILLEKPIIVSGAYGINYGMYDSAGLLKECQEKYSYEVHQGADEKIRQLKLSVISSELTSVESELEKISHMKFNVYEEEKRKERKLSKSYFTERRRVLRMLRQDNSNSTTYPAEKGKKIGMAHCNSTLSEFAKVIKSVEKEKKNLGSRFRILYDLETEDAGGVIKGRLFKKEEEEQNNKTDLSLMKEKSEVRYRLKGALAKKEKIKKYENAKTRTSKMKKIEKFRSKRKENRTKLLKETNNDPKSIKKVTSFMAKIAHFKREDKHCENLHPKSKERIIFHPSKFIKIMEKYIPKELLSFKLNENKGLDFNIYNTPKEWLEHEIQFKINKIRRIKLIE